MKRNIFAAWFLAAALLLVPFSASAASYSFQLSREQVDAYWNADGTLALDYVLVFQNDADAIPIDFVDIGMPNGNYDLSSMSATADNQAIQKIYASEYVNPGVTVEMGGYAIPAGKSGTVKLHVGRISNVLYPDDNDSNLASAVFSPNYFGSEYVHGATDLTVVFHLPPGVQPDEPKYHQPGNWPGPSEPTTGFDNADRVIYSWHATDANGSTQYTLGASFPARLVPETSIQRPTFFDKLGTLFATLGVTLEALSPCFCIGGSLAFIIGVSMLSVWSDNQRKKKYLPPKISIEGHGIKRGLTAVEAAMLLEQPLDKVMTMILFSVVKKGAATVTKRDPLALTVIEPISDQLNPYEMDFLKAFQLPTLPARRKALQEMTVKQINNLTEKMKGFSRKETMAYYQQIMEQAWKQVTAADTPEVKAQAMEENLEWTMLDNEFPDRSRTMWGSGPVYVPMWWGRYDPGFGGHTAVPANTGSMQMPSVSMPNLPGADFAASVVGGVQNFSQSVIGDLTGFTGAVTNRTNPVPVSTSSGRYSGGGGHSCACACACAGCACACAGGGR
jgi:hypothetical protein